MDTNSFGSGEIYIQRDSLFGKSCIKIRIPLYKMYFCIHAAAVTRLATCYLKVELSHRICSVFFPIRIILPVLAMKIYTNMIRWIFHPDLLHLDHEKDNSCYFFHFLFINTTLQSISFLYPKWITNSSIFVMFFLLFLFSIRCNT